jgi:hypothetical protein
MASSQAMKLSGTDAQKGPTSNAYSATNDAIVATAASSDDLRPV